MSKESDLESMKDDKTDYWSWYSPEYARFVLDNLDYFFEEHRRKCGWELSDTAKLIVIDKLTKIAKQGEQ